MTVLVWSIGNTANTQAQEMDKFVVQVDGLGCSFCAFGLDKRMKELKGIKKMKIDMEKGVMTFAYPTAKRLTKADVKQQVKKAGYTPVSVNVTRADGSVELLAEDTASVSVVSDVRIEFTVAGNCGMCKQRIETAAKTVEGVQRVAWDEATQLLRVLVIADTEATVVAAAVAAAGHDTEYVKTTEEVYQGLHGCCKYERLK